MRDGKPVTGEVTSVGVGLEYRLKFKEEIMNLSVYIKKKLSSTDPETSEEIINGVEGYLQGLINSEFPSELLYGYIIIFPPWGIAQEDEVGNAIFGQCADQLSNVLKPSLFRLVPKVEYDSQGGLLFPKLTINVFENVSSMMAGVSRVLWNVFYGKDPSVTILDWGFDLYWSAAVTDRFDMDQVEDAASSQGPAAPKKKPAGG